MAKAIKRLCIGFAIFIGVILLLLFGSYINHRVMLHQEDKTLHPIDTRYEVNGYYLNVYTEGTGDTTLVFMSGGGTCSPVLDFKSLYSRLSSNFRIVVVEKAGIQGPFVLCPHSMSGIEALYWAQKYPHEVKAIIGLDMSVPQSYENFQMNLPLLKLGAFAADAGILRWIPGIAESDAIKYGTLTQAEKEIYHTVFYRRTATVTMLNEVQEIKASAAKVFAGGTPDVPILIFSSNGQGTGWPEYEWRGYQKEFINSCTDGTMIELDCSHYIHDIAYETIAKEMTAFLTAR